MGYGFLAAEVRDCVLCGRPGQGLHPTTAGRACPQCYLKLFHCERCHVRLAEGGGVTYPDGLSYCQKCLSHPTCSCCGRRPAEESSNSCSRCLSLRAPCEVCDQHRAPEGDRFCRSCVGKHPFCPGCDSLTTEVWNHGSSGAPNCLKCGAKVRQCFRCDTRHTPYWEERFGKDLCRPCLGLEVDQRYVDFALCKFCYCRCDGSVCRDCESEAVTSIAETWELLGKTMRFLRREFGLEVETPFHLNVAGPGELARITPKSYREGSGVSGLYGPGREWVVLREGMPRWLAMSVLAHEYAHVWQWENCPPQSKDLREGFARWIQLKVLDALECERFIELLICEPCPDYGEGLRRCLAMEERLGERGVIEAVRELTEFPFWAKELAKES